MQANISISIPNESMAGVASSGLNGAYTVEEALRTLLAGKDYRFERAGERAYRVIGAPRRAALNAPPLSDAIIVTAAREATSLRRLPRSVSHIGADQLQNAGIDNDRELARLLGGVSFTNFGEGRDKILIRGLSDGALTGRTQSLVGLYFGDARITYAAPDPDLMLIDIASVDVLRGPQGALYGGGAIGGIFRIEPQGVDLHNFATAFGVSTETTQGGGIGQTFNAMVNQPLLRDRVGLRGVVYDDRTGGWTDNPTLNETDTNHGHRRGARLQASAELTPHWTITGDVVLQSIDTKDSQYLQRTPEGLARTAHLLEPHDNDFSLYGVTIRGATHWADITSNTSYVTHEFDSRFDVTGQFAALGIDPSQPRPLDEGDALQIIVHETRFTSRPGAGLPWFFGIFYAEGDSTRDTIIRDGAPGLWPGVAYSEHRVDSVDEAAVFGQVTWRLSSRLALATGLRLFQSNLSTQSTSNEPILSLSAHSAQHLSNLGAAPDIRLSYRASDTSLLYLSAAEGYRSGGFNTGGPIGAGFGPLQPNDRYAGDRIWTFEAGGRFNLDGGRLSLQSVAFLSVWRDVQTDALRANDFLYAGNVGDARALGAELSLHYLPTERLSIDADLLWSEPDITQVSATFPDAAHGTLPGAPEFSGAASVRYQDRLGAGLPASWFVQTDGRYVGSAKLGFGEGPSVGDFLELDARMGLFDRHWTLSIYADNLTNAHGPTFTPGNPYQPSLALETPLRPRTLGVSLQRRF